MTQHIFAKQGKNLTAKSKDMKADVAFLAFPGISQLKRASVYTMIKGFGSFFAKGERHIKAFGPL